MKGTLCSLAIIIAVIASASLAAQEPFLTKVGTNTWVIGNDVWNMTQGRTFGVKLMYKGQDCVGEAVGHYASYSMSLSYHPIIHALTLSRWRRLQP